LIALGNPAAAQIECSSDITVDLSDQVVTDEDASRCRWEANVTNRHSDKVSLSEKLGQFTETWSPRIAGELNGQLGVSRVR
jgi:hypothetical protein